MIEMERRITGKDRGVEHAARMVEHLVVGDRYAARGRLYAQRAVGSGAGDR